MFNITGRKKEKCEEKQGVDWDPFPLSAREAEPSFPTCTSDLSSPKLLPQHWDLSFLCSFIGAFKRAHCASGLPVSAPLCLFPVPDVVTTGLLWNSLLPRGLVAFFGDKLWQVAQESWASLPAWPCLLPTKSFSFCSVLKNLIILPKLSLSASWEIFHSLWVEISRAHCFCAVGRSQTSDFHGNFFPVLQWTFCLMEPGQCWVLGGGSWTAILLKSTQISWWLISSTENEYRSVFRCLNWKFFM